jgi:murein DD-endopeptidase MepM/ murein hydrolase activator NlpD
MHPARQRPPQAVALLTALLLAVPLAAAKTAAAPDSRWRKGIFPVTNFQGFTSHYGMRRLSGGKPQSHNGLDIAAPLGSAVRSWWSGRVLEVINDGACGHGLVIGSGPYKHIYCHLGGRVQTGVLRSGAVELQQGSRVRFGQVIGHVGLTGYTTGPHLHWGLRYNGEWLDPAHVLRAMAASRAGT